MVDNKNKTKAAMMQELESIKGLLLEDDEIPILQEVFASESERGFNSTAPANNESKNKAAQTPMSRQHIEALHDQFEALGQSIAGKHADPDHRDTKAPQNASSLLDAFTRAAPPQIPKAPQPTPKLQQPSLFQEDTQGPDEGSRSDSNAQRPALAKASGENPFLPQHIRARLHGNNPPPMFDYAASTSHTKAPTTPIQTTTKSNAEMLIEPPKHSEHKDSPLLPTKHQLIKEVIATVMPQLEKELQHKLEQLSQQELERLRNPDA